MSGRAVALLCGLGVSLGAGCTWIDPDVYDARLDVDAALVHESKSLIPCSAKTPYISLPHETYGPASAQYLRRKLMRKRLEATNSKLG